MAPFLTALVLLVVERLPRLRFRPSRLLRPHAATDAAHLLVSYAALGAAAVTLAAFASARVAAWTGLAALWPSVPWGVQVIVALVALDLGNYVAHWLLHRVDTLWELHKVHHSSLRLDWLATFRSHVGEQLLRQVLAPVLLVAAGMPIGTIAVAAGLFLSWAMLNHANVCLPLGALERVLITPRLHRVHHVPGTSERNLGTILNLWDRWRGTLVVGDPPPETVFGFPRQPADYPQDWPGQLVAPWHGPARAGRSATTASVPAPGAGG